MEDTLDQLSKDVEHIFLSKIFEENCPFFLAIGMSYEQYWEQDPTIAKYYLKAYKIQEEKIEWLLWKLGVYGYEALCDVSPVLHAFAKKGTKPLPFTDKPLFIKNDEQETVEERKKREEQEAENERLKAEIKFKMWAKAVSKKFNKEETK